MADCGLVSYSSLKTYQGHVTGIVIERNQGESCKENSRCQFESKLKKKKGERSAKSAVRLELEMSGSG
ncbi:hypothetical protein TREES_T100017884 [Tupaia chinensis]|uniref:Uncharacterized protein n=1 Tax=Tupaia chinensis TaxID=246437 RepID=L9KG39_TUPCH|nr:hypothetical protein TREES_T100017884 [Tupaia chinensis]